MATTVGGLKCLEVILRKAIPGAGSGERSMGRDYGVAGGLDLIGLIIMPVAATFTNPATGNLELRPSAPGDLQSELKGHTIFYIPGGNTSVQAGFGLCQGIAVTVGVGFVFTRCDRQ